MVTLTWAQEMEALMEHTRKNWENTGKRKKSKGLNCSFELGSKKKEETS